MHDLVHQHARRASAHQDTPAEQQRAIGRLLDYYVHAAAAADAAMPFLGRGEAPSAGGAPAEVPPFADKNAAFTWYAAEYENLIAAFETALATGADAHACELPRFMRAFFARRCGTTHLNFLFERSLAAAERLGDPRRRAEIHSDLGFARYNAGRMAEAHDQYRAAAELLGDDPWLSAELTLRRAYLTWDEGQVDAALELFREAGRRFADCPAGAAHATAAEAWATLQLGHRDEAARLARETLAVPHADPAWPPALTARITLGVAIADDHPDEAAGHLHQALELARADGHKHNEAWCLNCLGVALRRMGRYDEALASHRQAFALLDELFEEHWKIHFLDSYAETCRAAGLPRLALELHREALELAPKVGFRQKEALAHEGIAAVLAATDPAAAAEHRAARGIDRAGAGRGGVGGCGPAGRIRPAGASQGGDLGVRNSGVVTSRPRNARLP
jgi:tetratricopeptide (TPR) repeat protein